MNILGFYQDHIKHHLESISSHNITNIIAVEAKVRTLLNAEIKSEITSDFLLSRTAILLLLYYTWVFRNKTVQISKLSNYFPLPIKLESKGQHIQRFLTLKEFSLPLCWFPLVKKIIENLFSISSEVFMSVDHSRDVACNVPTRFWLWQCSSSILKVL